MRSGVRRQEQRHVRKTDDAHRVSDTWTYVARGQRHQARAVLPRGQALRVQISTDGLRQNALAIPAAFAGDVDYAQIVKSYEAEPIGPGSPRPT
jgi:hypothetical protein